MPHSIEKLLIDIRIACEEIQAFCSGKSFEGLLEDRQLQLALEREFEIIGEALVRLERLDEVNLNQAIPEYRKIIGFRNLVAHGYDTIDDAALWDLAINHVPVLLNKVLNY
ncbi:MAG: HepT-like ribonuclease domain-containing protein [Opitutaceae bacterium]